VGRLAEVEEFANIVVKVGADRQLVRVKDVARVELGARVQDVTNRFDDKTTIGLAIFVLPDCNALETRDAVVSTVRIESVSRAATYAEPKVPGFVKLFADARRGVLVGAVVVGPEAGEWLGQLTLAVRAAVPVEVLRDTIQPFPTFSEAIFFAARDLDL